MKNAHLLPVFSAAFAGLYVIVLYFNLAMFTYHPAINAWDWLVTPPRAGPTMYWYGLIATSAVGAAIVTVVAALVPAQWRARVWTGWTWLIPIAAMAIVLFILRSYFIR
jgi:hypothetical protein